MYTIWVLNERQGISETCMTNAYNLECLKLNIVIYIYERKKI